MLEVVKFINVNFFLYNLMIITISGTSGSGKSTVAKILVGKLNAERIYAGGIFREMAREKGMTLIEFEDYAKKHPEVDKEVDDLVAGKARKFEKKGRIVIAEGRAQFHFLPESIKIYIKVSVEEGARRIWKDLQDKEKSGERNEGKVSSLEQMKKKVQEREEADAQRYKKFYGIDHRIEKQYDFVVDTTKLDAEQAAGKVLDFIRSRTKNLDTKAYK